MAVDHLPAGHPDAALPAPPEPAAASVIVNDPNAWGDEHGDPRYILDLVKRITTVSLETVQIMNGLPSLEFGA